MVPHRPTVCRPWYNLGLQIRLEAHRVLIRPDRQEARGKVRLHLHFAEERMPDRGSEWITEGYLHQLVATLLPVMGGLALDPSAGIEPEPSGLGDPGREGALVAQAEAFQAGMGKERVGEPAHGYLGGA